MELHLGIFKCDQPGFYMWLNPLDDPLIERPAFMPVCFANEDAEQCSFVWKLHNYLQIE